VNQGICVFVLVETQLVSQEPFLCFSQIKIGAVCKYIFLQDFIFTLLLCHQCEEPHQREENTIVNANSNKIGLKIYL
jgi:hypothetical protein